MRVKPSDPRLSFTSKIRFVALEGIEEERDYPHQLGLVDNLLVGEVEGEERFDAPTQYRYRTIAKLALIKKPKKKWWHFW